MKKILFMLIIVLFICGCNNNVEKNIINMEEIRNIMSNSEYLIIDVRSKEEYDEIHIKDAINIPYNEINKSVDIDKNKILFVYCKSGNRSKIAYETLSKLGYTVYDLGSIDNIELEKTIQ